MPFSHNGAQNYYRLTGVKHLSYLVELLPLEHDHGQTDSRARAQRLSAAHHKSHMVDPDWIHILGKQPLPCVKGKVTVYVTCQCSENRCFWCVIDHKYKALCCVALCTVLFRSILTDHVSNTILSWVCVERMVFSKPQKPKQQNSFA